ncbi:uncharacterized protein KY384_006099 [Bacidia gigantensis]|uniref:uncharacterized protein n=1 Tax=Bacidia gigantensis TaxID=2732470 RepID=UPI001D04C790|nr:uncharacterized protein KY384_006099 [Bacidia gigantensis]KAG8529462.1 hypothetical protein KY384_006099 [Bacidia gigantensis]
MINCAIEAFELIFEHVYRSRPVSARTLLPLYLAHPIPRPSLIHLPDVNPSTLLFSVTHTNLLFLSPVSAETESLFVLEFIHRVIDVLEEFLGAPLLSSKIGNAYDVVAQLLGEMCDAGNVCNTEPNVLRDDVEVSGMIGKLLGGIGLPSTVPTPNSAANLKQQLGLTPLNSGPAIPWRRATVRHTSNELYVDIVETLSVTLAPSGRPLAAFANGSILFTAKISGVPDLLLTLSASGGTLGMEKAIELPVFHPCVRLARWKERPGELSFVPPDGKFMLAGYEVNLMPSKMDLNAWSKFNLQLPVSIEVSKSLGPLGLDFEVRLLISSILPGAASSSSGSRPAISGRSSGRSTPNIFSGSSGSSAGPNLQNLTVTIPLPVSVRNVKDLQPSRGEAFFSATENLVEWRIPNKDLNSVGNATLRCTVIGNIEEDDEVEDAALTLNPVNGDYDENEDTYQAISSKTSKAATSKKGPSEYQDKFKVQQNSIFMPSSASVSFGVKGWLASGIKVQGLTVDTKRSRGLGEGVKPYKGVKYLTVSSKGVETRC